MSGKVVKMPTRKQAKPLETVTLTPEMAVDLLEHNTHNRPLSEIHVQRIARQIKGGKWKFNGDTIKVADNGDVLDGQHRCWAVIEAKTPVETIIVRGIERDAFTTIDTIHRHRSGGDTLSLMGVDRYARQTAVALTWLARWQRGIITQYRDPKNKIENSDVERMYEAHPNMTMAMERCMPLRGLVTPSTIGWLYYLLASHDEETAERMIATLMNPGRVKIDDPFYRLRSWLSTHTQDRHRDALLVIALTIKAINAARNGQMLKALSWKHQGTRVEAFPELNLKNGG